MQLTIHRLIIEADDFHIKIPESITQESVNNAVAEQVRAYLPRIGGDAKSTSWQDFLLKSPSVKYLVSSLLRCSSIHPSGPTFNYPPPQYQISINSMRLCATPLSSWELTRVQTAGQLSEAIYKRSLRDAEMRNKIDCVERYLLSNDAPPNLHYQYPSRSKNRRVRYSVIP